MAEELAADLNAALSAIIDEGRSLTDAEASAAMASTRSTAS